jgi:propionyl-CoA carboxylase alpha chain
MRQAEVPCEGERLGLAVARSGQDWLINTRGAKHRARVLPARLAPLAEHMIEREPPDLSRLLISPMPGLLVALHVGEGEEVQAGQQLATVEAMKMENILRAEKQAVVKSINLAAGTSVAADEIILEFE